MKMTWMILGLSLATSSVWAVQPNWNLTPGVLCTRQDPDYSQDRYPEKIAYCKRNVSHDDKVRIAQQYGNIPESQWKNYEFDHLIPLAAGGSNDIGNIWPQPIGEAKGKDVVEQEVFDGLNSGKMTQDQAVKKIMLWLHQH